MMRSPLLQMLVDTHGIEQVSEENVEAFLAQHKNAILLFTENPKHFPESNDVAVVLPELLHYFNQKWKAAVVSESAERILFKRYAFNKWPALVFFRNSEYLGVVTGMQDWQVFCQAFDRMLQAQPVKPPSFGIPIVEESVSACHTGK